MKTPICVLICLLVINLKSFSQNENLINDLPYFNTQIAEYQRWLDYKGMGQVLKAQRVEIVDHDHQVLGLFLGFQYHDIDSIKSGWKYLKKTYEAPDGLTLEHQLFFRMTHLMSVEPAQATLFVQDDVFEICDSARFCRQIWLDTDARAITVFEHEKKLKADPRYVKINFPKTSATKNTAKTAIKMPVKKEEVFEKILTFAKNKYQTTNCTQRSPEVAQKPLDDVLVFEVTDLCREVLTNNDNPTLCKWLKALGQDCNWIGRELLEFRFVYSENGTEGYALTMTLSGKIGSGFYENKRGPGFSDMEIDYKTELETYTDKFQIALKNYLEKP